MELSNLQLAFMALCGIAFVIYLIWRSESVDRVTFLAREREATKKQEERDRDARERRRMVYEADRYNDQCSSMEPFCGEGKKP